MKMTLLEMTQNILSAMDSDEVNSVADTVESLQVAEEIRTTFYEVFSNRMIPELAGLVTLEGIQDLERPNVLRLKDKSARIKWLRYKNFRNKGELRELEYISPEEFMQRFVFQGNSENDHWSPVKLIGDNPFTYNIQNNRCPQYWTSFDDKHLVFDSFDQENETTLHGSSAIAWGTKNPEFKLEDDFVPPIDDHLFPLLLAEAKSACFVNIKQIANSKEEQRARRQLVRSQNKKLRTGYMENMPNDYSRRR